MTFTIEIKISKSDTDALEVVNMFRAAKIEVQHAQGLQERGINIPVELVLALSSAGTFTAMYQVVCKLIEKNKDREIIIKHGDTEVTIKGHRLLEEHELLNKLLPELDQEKNKTKKKKNIQKKP